MKTKKLPIKKKTNAYEGEFKKTDTLESHLHIKKFISAELKSDYLT